MPVSMCFINILKNPLTCDVVVENVKKKIIYSKNEVKIFGSEIKHIKI